MLPTGLLTLLSYISWAHLPRDDIAHSGLGTLTSTKMAPTDLPQDNLKEAIPQLRFLFPL